MIISGLSLDHSCFESRIRKVASGCEFVSLRRRGPYTLDILVRTPSSNFETIEIEAPKIESWKQEQLDTYLVGQAAFKFAERSTGVQATTLVVRLREALRSLREDQQKLSSGGWVLTLDQSGISILVDLLKDLLEVVEDKSDEDPTERG